MEEAFFYFRNSAFCRCPPWHPSHAESAGLYVAGNCKQIEFLNINRYQIITSGTGEPYFLDFSSVFKMLNLVLPFFGTFGQVCQQLPDTCS